MKPISRSISCAKWIASAVAIVVFPLAQTDSFAIQLGDPAPPIKVSEWIKNGPVAIAPGTNIYVVDFWSSESPTCTYTVPYVNNMQKQFRNRGVVFVGISADPVAKARKFLSSLESPVEYAMASDKGSESSHAYLTAVEASDLPHAFVINREGKVVWHGNATVALEQVLNEVLGGTFTLDSARRTIAAEEGMREYYKLAYGGTNTARMKELGEQIVSNASGYSGILNEFAWKILTDRRIRTTARDFQLALKASEGAYQSPEGKVVPIMDTYARALFGAGKHAEAIAMEEQAIADCKDPRYRPELESVRLRFLRLSRTNSVPRK
jgi:peroxiredoxin